ncbi:MAG TPA: Lrp/AsnC ligand binding domain-containing protein [Candidatus Binatia bacterium]|nr:Lrp/AsnC ligand binding domain-containing protein [Candidatus Binatia bacterium]
MEITKKDLIVLSHFRQDARCRLTALSRATGIPVSTLFDKLTAYQQDVVVKTISLINFDAVGFGTHAQVLLRCGRDRDGVKDYLVKHPLVNSLYKVNNGFDFLAECVFRTMKELEHFVEHLRAELDVRSTEVYYLVDSLKREGFLADPSLVDALIRDPQRVPTL